MQSSAHSEIDKYLFSSIARIVEVMLLPEQIGLVFADNVRVLTLYLVLVVMDLGFD